MMDTCHYAFAQTHCISLFSATVMKCPKQLTGESKGLFSFCFWRFQSVIKWPHGFGSLGSQYIMAGVWDRAKPLTTSARKDREVKRSGSHCPLQENVPQGPVPKCVLAGSRLCFWELCILELTIPLKGSAHPSLVCYNSAPMINAQLSTLLEEDPVLISNLEQLIG
jgi:hypothetical protein